MKLLAISSSPRAGGNTELLLEQVLRGLGQAERREGQADISVEKCRLGGLDIRPCNQCGACEKTGNCTIKDEMAPLYGKLIEADWLILASPIYFMAHCAQAKLLIDRCQPFWARRYILKQSLVGPNQTKRRGIFLAVGATHGPKVFAGAKVTMRWFLDALQMEYWADLLFDGTDRKASILQHPTAVREAFELGGKIARASVE